MNKNEVVLKVDDCTQVRLLRLQEGDIVLCGLGSGIDFGMLPGLPNIPKGVCFMPVNDVEHIAVLRFGKKLEML